MTLYQKIFSKYDINTGRQAELDYGKAVISIPLNGIDVNSPSGNIFLGYIIGTEDAAGKVFSDFPPLSTT